MKKLKNFTNLGLLLIIFIMAFSCNNGPNNDIELQTDLQRYEEIKDSNPDLKDLQTFFNQVNNKKPAQEKPIFLRKVASVSQNWILDGTTAPQILYITPTLDPANPFFYTIYSQLFDCYNVADYLPAQLDLTILSQSAELLAIQHRHVDNALLTDIWIFTINSDDKLQFDIYAYDNGILIPGSFWSMYHTATPVDLTTLTYCPGEDPYN